MEDKIETIQHKIFKGEISDDINDLLKVGPLKPVSYLPMDYVDDYKDNISREELQKYFEDKGLKVKILDPMDEGTISDEFFVWDNEALKAFLERNTRILDKYGWTTDPEHFIDKLGSKIWAFDEYPDLYVLIAYAFADYNNPIVLEQKDIKVVK